MTYSNSNSNSRSRGTTVMSLTRYTIGQVQTAIVESATSSPLAVLKLKTEKTNVISILGLGGYLFIHLVKTDENLYTF